MTSPFRGALVLATCLLTSCGGVLTGFSPGPYGTVASSAASIPAPSDPCHPNGATYCVLNPGVSQATTATTICVRGWTATVRPSVAYTNKLKREQLAAEGSPYAPREVEEDHRMPLELGGAPSDPQNLSPEHPRSPNPKDQEESRLREGICVGRVTLAQAQVVLVRDWLKPWPGYTR